MTKGLIEAQTLFPIAVRLVLQTHRRELVKISAKFRPWFLFRRLLFRDKVLYAYNSWSTVSVQSGPPDDNPLRDSQARLMHWHRKSCPQPESDVLGGGEDTCRVLRRNYSCIRRNSSRLRRIWRPEPAAADHNS